MQFLENELKEYAEFAWSTFDFEICPSSETSDEKIEHLENSIAANVQISGEWQGAITLSIETDLACQLAERMFSRAKGLATQEELRDAMAEMINMIGGNIKSLLKQPCFLSIPVVELKKASLHFPFMEQVSRVMFDCMGMKFGLVVHQAIEQNPSHQPSGAQTSTRS